MHETTRSELFFRGLVLLLACWFAGETDAKENRWEAAIAKMEATDRESPPKPGGIVFVGSSSIRMWKLDTSFPDLPVANRGFGGSQVADSLFFADRIILPYDPRIVVVYAGDNDIAAGKSPEQVSTDYRHLVEKIHTTSPKTRIVFIAIKPSLARWKLVEKMRKANTLIRQLIEKDKRLTYVDIDTPMIGKDGKPRKELFKSDGLHLNEEGYKLWTECVRPHLESEIRNRPHP